MILLITVIVSWCTGCVYYGDHSSLMFTNEVSSFKEHAIPIILTKPFTVIATTRYDLTHRDVLYRYTWGGIPNAIIGETYKLPPGTALYIDQIRTETDYFQLIIPIFPIPYRKYWSVSFYESLEDKQSCLTFYGFGDEQDILRMLRTRSL